MQLIDVGNEHQQKFTIISDGFELEASIKFLSVAEQWIISVDYSGKKINGAKLSVGVLHMDSQGYPFDFIVEDSTGSGLDPYRLEDFSTGRTNLYLITNEEITNLRGYAVEIS